MKVNSKEECMHALKSLAYEFGLHFICGNNLANITHLDNKAWIDTKIPGITKLNCFLEIPQAGYNWLKGVQWAPAVNKRVDKPKTSKSKGARGTVLQEGPPTQNGLEILNNWGSDLVSESYEIALYENELYQPVLINMEFKILSKQFAPGTRFPKESLIMNAHISTKIN